MANKSDHENAAKKTPSNRTVAEQALVDEGVRIGIGDTRNIDVAAKRHESIYGKK